MPLLKLCKTLVWFVFVELTAYVKTSNAWISFLQHKRVYSIWLIVAIKVFPSEK